MGNTFVEPVFFHQGVSYDSRSCLQGPGFLRTGKNIVFEVDGSQSLRPSFQPLNSLPLSPIHSIKAWRGSVIGGSGSKLVGNNGGGEFTTLYSAFSGSPWEFKAYKNFLVGVDGKNIILVDERRNVYDGQIQNPATAPTGTAGSSGSPNGTYRLYVSYYIVWPNGHTYETGLSPASSDVTVSSKKITWGSIPKATYSPFYGVAPAIYRNLYRGPGTGGALTEIFYLTTLDDNTTVTYSDDVSDVVLEQSFACTVQLYGPPVSAKFLAWHYGRLFLFSSEYPNRLYWTEVALGNTAEANESLFPIAMDEYSWDDIRVVGVDNMVPQGVVAWGSYLYVPLSQTWIRKQGDDPSSWAYRKTYSTHGIGAPRTVDTTDFGIVGMTDPEFSDPGLAMFNGQYTELFTSPKLDWLFKTDLNLDAISECRGKRVGRYYMLLYPSVGKTTPDRFLAVDLRRYPEVRVAQWTDLEGYAVDVEGRKMYVGGVDGVVRGSREGEGIDVEVETRDLVGGKPDTATIPKVWRELKYALDSGGKEVSLQLFVDGEVVVWPDGAEEKVVSGVDETLQVIRSLPNNTKGYRMRVVVKGTSLTTLELYSPWHLEGEFVV